MKIQAVLLDVGGVLVDETRLYQLMQNQLLELLQNEGISTSLEEVSAISEQAWGRNLGNSVSRAAILWHFVKPDLERFQRLRKALIPLRDLYDLEKPQLVPGATAVVTSLSLQYKLALAANQPAKIKEFSEFQGILRYFQYALVSEELGLAKPDPLFFQIILDKLGVRPEEAIMVGDRLDNDIAPAKMLGMKTIRVLVWPFVSQQLRSPEEQPDLTIHKIAELPRALDELAQR